MKRVRRGLTYLRLPSWLAAACLLALLAGQLPLRADATIDLSGPWRFKGDWEENGQQLGWHNPDYDDSDWKVLTVPGDWETQGIKTVNPRWQGMEPDDHYNGYAWYRRRIPIPADWADSRVVLSLGTIDDMDWTYFNGELIGSTTGDRAFEKPRSYEVPAHLLRPGADNVIAVRVCDHGGKGGIVSGPVELVRYGEPEAALDEALDAEARRLERRYRQTRGDMVQVGGSVTVPADTKVNGDAVAIMGSVDVMGYVTGDVVAVMGSVRLRPGARVDGDVVTVGGSLRREGDAHLGGSVSQLTFLPWSAFDRWVHNPMLGVFGWRQDRSGPLAALGAFIRRLLFWGVLAIAMALIMPRRLEAMARALPLYPGWVAFHGVVGAILTPAAMALLVMVAVLAIVILAITVVGIALIPAVALLLACLLLGFGVILLLGLGGIWVSIGQAIGARLASTAMAPVPASVLGVAITAAASTIPGLGTLVIITLLLFAYGLAVMTGVGASPEWTHRLLHIGAREHTGAAGAPAAAPPSQDPPAPA